jgi:hypothetical protein
MHCPSIKHPHIIVKSDHVWCVSPFELEARLVFPSLNLFPCSMMHKWPKPAVCSVAHSTNCSLVEPSPLAPHTLPLQDGLASPPPCKTI